ncbi:MAG: NUDIX hydrolase, partial [Pseudomonas sp.]
MTWLPHITVATIVEDNGRFLMVEELKGGRAVLNQPAGHLDPNETLTE